MAYIGMNNSSEGGNWNKLFELSIPKTIGTTRYTCDISHYEEICLVVTTKQDDYDKYAMHESLPFIIPVNAITEGRRLLINYSNASYLQVNVANKNRWEFYVGAAHSLTLVASLYAR